MMKTISILVADDHSIVRETFALLLITQDDLKVVGVAASGEEACRLAAALKPQVVLMDVSMPGMGGVEATKCIVGLDANVRVVAFSGYEDEAYLAYMLEAGASGYVSKQSAFSEIVQAIRNVIDGGVHIDPFMMGKLAIAEDTLSVQEMLVMQMSVRGMANKEMASHIDVGIKSIETYKTRINKKLTLSSRADWVRYALARG